MITYLTAALAILFISWQSSVSFIRSFNSAFALFDHQEGRRLRNSEWPPTDAEFVVNPWNGVRQTSLYPRLDYAGRPSGTSQSIIFASP